MRDMDVYVFPNTVNLTGTRARLDTDKSGRLLYSPGGDVTIDSSVMHDSPCAIVLKRDDPPYVLYNFHEILQIMDMTPHEFLSSLGIHGLLQIDICSGELFANTFLPRGKETLDKRVARVRDGTFYMTFSPSQSPRSAQGTCGSAAANSL